MLNKDRSRWTPQMRQRQADLMRQALKHERAAFEQLQIALDWVQPLPGQVRPAGLAKHRLSSASAPAQPYAGAGVPLAVMQALRQAGSDVDFTDLVAGGGWAMSFSYNPDSWHCAGLSCTPFAFVPERLGFQRHAASLKDRDAAWNFIRQHIDAGRLIVCEHLDGGLIYGYRQRNGTREVWYDGTIDLGWRDIEKLEPAGCFAFEKVRDPLPAVHLYRESLAEIVKATRSRTAGSTAFGLRALQTYAADVQNPQKSFDNLTEWFCWAAFERLCNRAAAATWLRRAADTLGGDARPHLLAAADDYDQAHRAYAAYEQAVHDPAHASLPWNQRMRSPDRIATFARLLNDGIAAETKAIESLAKAEDAARSMKLPPLPIAHLRFGGNGHKQDSFSLAFQTAATRLGVDVDYDTLACLSTNAFSPAVNPAEDCGAWWHVEGSLGDRAIDLVAKSLGLRAQRLTLPPLPASADTQQQTQARFIAHRRACADTLAQAMERGIVLAPGGWELSSASGFVPWGWWGIITRIDSNNDPRGACLPANPNNPVGLRDHPMAHVPENLWLLTKGDNPIDPQQARRAALELAVQRIRGQGAFKAAKDALYGLDAVDAWIQRMSPTPFCTPCADKSWTCALNNGHTTISAATSAARWLRHIAPDAPAASRPHLEAAAKHYDNVAQLLHPATHGKGSDHYAALLATPARQADHAKTLQQLRTELSAVANALEKALKTE